MSLVWQLDYRKRRFKVAHIWAHGWHGAFTSQNIYYPDIQASYDYYCLYYLWKKRKKCTEWVQDVGFICDAKPQYQWGRYSPWNKSRGIDENFMPHCLHSSWGYFFSILCPHPQNIMFFEGKGLVKFSPHPFLVGCTSSFFSHSVCIAISTIRMLFFSVS